MSIEIEPKPPLPSPVPSPLPPHLPAPLARRSIAPWVTTGAYVACAVFALASGIIWLWVVIAGNGGTLP